MSGQVYVVDNMHVIAATEKLARFKVQQNLQIQIDIDLPSSECSTLTCTSREDEPPTPTSCRLDDDLMGEEEPCEKKKRRRRTAAQIDRKYVCSYAGCKKAYGSEGSLTQHMRLKHRNLALSHRDRGHIPSHASLLVVSSFFAPNCNNIAIRPAISYLVDLSSAYSPPTPCFVGNESADASFGLEKLRMRSNSMPSDMSNQMTHQAACETPRWSRSKKTTPQSARAYKAKAAAQVTKAKMKRSQSMSSPQGPFQSPEQVGYARDPGLSIEALKLSPNYGYVTPQMQQGHSYDYPKQHEMSMLSTLDWSGAAAASVKEERQDENDLSVLDALVENDPVMTGHDGESTAESFTPTSPPLFCELDDSDMLGNQYDNNVAYYRQAVNHVQPTAATMHHHSLSLGDYGAALDMDLGYGSMEPFMPTSQTYPPAALASTPTFFM
ncbi:Aste57867_18482 [Aphanomyces stellatus]|uniref:Aste57867_18482 protein n=1 Tax=Aphanomyces stellatus TaxID=120398 RepID=A0A485LBU5_9STRA|nr:hypothetical protein As57867_018420 [Aphanomyces stellatus]VFT95218.1 Aste57867_18482 [Aphanomyces stellatus]